MKKIIRLTEQDLSDIVGKVLSKQMSSGDFFSTDGKKEKGDNPAECLKEAQEAMKCTSNM